MGFIAGTSRYLPENTIYNKDLVQFPEKYRELIREKAGILSRRHVDTECTSDIGAKAVQLLLDKNDISSDSIDALICATSSPDRIQPATATRIQELCHLNRAFCFDVNSVCCGSLFALKIANSLVNDGLSNVIVVGAEVYSKILNPRDITTYPYFGDGAGAVLLSKNGKYEFIDFLLYTDGKGCDVIQIPAGGTSLPYSKVTREKDYYFQMNGPKVYDFACAKGMDIILQLKTKHNVFPDRVITHQANINIIKCIAEKSAIPYKQFYVNVDKYANTAAASVLIALDEYLEIDKGEENVFLVAFGGGLSWAGAYLRKTKD